MQHVPLYGMGVAQVGNDNTLKALWYQGDFDREFKLRYSGLTAYVSRYYVDDPVFLLMTELRRSAAAGNPRVLLHELRWDDLPDSEWRRRNYQRNGLIQRAVIATAIATGELYGVTFFRQEAQGYFTPEELEWLARAAPMLIRLVIKHDQVVRGGLAPASEPEFIESKLVHLCGNLTIREAEVCTRLVRGMRIEDVAGELGIGAESVKTYRKRAFCKLGITMRSELYSLFLG